MKNAEMNKTKGMSMGETVLYGWNCAGTCEKNKYIWVITYPQVSQSGQLQKFLTQLTINEIC